MDTQTDFVIPKKRNCIKIILIIIAVLIIIAGTTVFWLVKNGLQGLFKDSGLTKLLGLNEQIQIEETTNIDLDKNILTEKLGYDIEAYNRSDLKMHKYLNIVLNSREATFLISKMQKHENSVNNVQIKIDDKSNLILSAVVNVDTMVKAFGGDKSEIESAIGRLPEEVPLYTEINLDYDSESSRLSDLKVGKVTIPKVVYSPIEKNIDSGVKDFFDNVLGIRLENINIIDGELNIVGDFPAP